MLPPAAIVIFSFPTRAPSVPAFTTPSSRSWKWMCGGGPLVPGGSAQDRLAAGIPDPAHPENFPGAPVL
jgi:hypothetical protein